MDKRKCSIQWSGSNASPTVLILLCHFCISDVP